MKMVPVICNDTAQKITTTGETTPRQGLYDCTNLYHYVLRWIIIYVKL